MLRKALARRFREWPGLVLASWSSQNLDRLRTVYEAAREAGRALVVDLYTATLARAAGFSGVPALGEDGLRVYLRKNESRAIVESQDFGRTQAVRRARLYPENFAERGRELVVMFRPSALPQFESAGALRGALAVWSLWGGYLKNPLEQRMQQVFADQGVKLERHHVSGHAYVKDLQQLVAAVAPGRVIPIHTEEPARYGRLFPAVDVKGDGCWWSVE
jgi:ribonuclease J